MPIEDFSPSQIDDEDVQHLKAGRGRARPDMTKLREFNEVKVAKAQEICSSCPVRKLCLSSAHPADLYWTVRGGARPVIMESRARNDARTRPPIAGIDEYPEYRCKQGHTGDENRHRSPNGKMKCRTCNAEKSRGAKVDD